MSVNEAGEEKARQNPPSTNLRDFYGRDFIITKDVLIPRPETEQLIDAVLTLAGKSYLPGVKPTARQLPEHPVIVDVGTGSGCIAITIKKELPEAEVYATDISKKALDVARQNTRLHNTPIHLIISHLCEKVNITPDLIVANLPYVDSEWTWLDKAKLAEEPPIALYAEDHGLALIKELIDTATSGYLVLEADPCQHEAIIDYAKNKYALIDARGFILSFKKPRNDC